ncbi:MAG: nitrite reductase large subunit NirB [Pseudomonadota bacterium]|nr:MAG: nitrite reductase (NAD(P)H) [Pseudomonadota bacterium]
MSRKQLVVIGNGMVGHRFLTEAAELGLVATHHVIVCGEEPRPAYDRVHLSQFFEGKDAAALALATVEEYEQLGIELRLGDPAVAIDRNAKRVHTRSGATLEYDTLVLATGSRPFVPNVPGNDLPNCFVYRTIEDLEAIRDAAARAESGVVIGGGLLGLEAAGALVSLGLAAHVVEFMPRLMPLQVDDAGGAVLRDRIEALGVQVHLGKQTTSITRTASGSLELAFADGSRLETDLVVFSAGIRARDDLARAAGLSIGDRGGIVVDARCRTSDASIYAIGECASLGGKTYGLVAPGYRMAEVVARTLAGKDAACGDFDLSTKLKLLGVDVGSFGDAFAATPGARVISLFDGVARVYKKLVLSADRRRLLGGMLVGDASSYASLQSYVQNGIDVGDHPEALLVPPSQGGAPSGPGVENLPDSALVCSCHNVTKGTICTVIREQGLAELPAVKKCTKAGTGCGSCATLVADLLKAELVRAGVTVNNHLCEHFPHTRQELFHIVRVRGIRTFEQLIREHGRGQGCEICKPAVASILASTWNDYILKKEHAGLQDTNDRYLANIQRDGTYSVVPRVAAGEITPDQLIALGTIAKKHGLYTKITGGQRIDMFGARLEQLPAIWRDLVDAGFESGHAYGKALRTVKSCVGSTWCRYGVQDSVGLALRLEHRYKGLRSPHKLKGAVSGCARECAEAQGKDFGVIATERGFNLYVCGNGGMKPQHAVLLAADIDADTVVRYLDRFLMFYVRTADRLQRTATWLNKLEGGIDYVRKVVVDDSLGIAAELEADMARIVNTYQCEWKTTLEDPDKVRMFRSFVNSDTPDPSVVFVREREQHRPAFWSEKQRLLEQGRVRLPVVPA